MAGNVSAKYCRAAYVVSFGIVTALACWPAAVAALAGRPTCTPDESPWQFLMKASFCVPAGWEPLTRGLALDLFATCTLFGFSLFSDNSSVYDPYWCVGALWVLAYWWFAAGQYALRTYIIVALVTAWAVRYFVLYPWCGWTTGLTEEDWRYDDVRQQLGPPYAGYWIFSLMSLHITPTLLVWGAMLPAGRVITSGGGPLNGWDAIACVGAIAAIALQTVADETLRKHRASGDARTCIAGPWAWSRHPNYLGECCFWTTMSLFAVAAGARDAVLFVGPVLLWLFFRFASTPLMEARSLARRPDYASCYEGVAILVPLPFVSRRAKRRD
mmetsp:Transcript_25861/g.77664  ORF Transcript_25861/g.77664 Transcript_25861/m.77664 type:complete len:328 (+) Transcript_25861:215-1198(+)